MAIFRIITHPIYEGVPNEIHFHGHPFIKLNTTEFQRRYGASWQQVMKDAVNELINAEWGSYDKI